MMSDVELQKLARYIVIEQSKNEAFMKALVKAQASLKKEKLVSPKVAADNLGISVRQLRRIKEHFSYIKSGESAQSGLLFNANTLVEEYEAYVSSRGTKVVPLETRKVAF